MAIGPISARPLEWNPPKAAVSRVPYLPGLDGMRALAVVAVMVYHANNAWLPGGFIGVEVFFVISGYLITLLLIGEHERTGRIGLREFWTRRARRLLPALFTMMAALVTYAALFDRDQLGRIRGDVIAGAVVRVELVPDLGRPGIHVAPATGSRCATCGAWPSRSSSTSCGRWSSSG